MNRPGEPLVNTLLARTKAHPEGIAFLVDGGLVSHAAFGRMISAVADRLRREGAAKGDRILLAAPNGVAWAAAYFGVHAAGCVAVPLDFDASQETARRIADECQIRLAITAKELPISGVPIPLDSICSEQASIGTIPNCDGDDIADILYTTGSTGTHKAVVLSHGQIAQAARNINAFVGGGPGDREVVPIPLSHSFGLGRLRCMAQSGATLVLEAGMRNAAKMLLRLLEVKATGLAMVPAGFELLLAMTKDRLADARDHLRYIEIGSSAMRMETKRKLMELLPHTRICHHYGLTEASRSTFIEYHADRDHLDSIGRSSPHVQVAVLGDDGRLLGPGEPGELCVRGAMVMKEYWRQPELTRQTLRDGWLHTGDWGRYDERGYFYLIGRRTDVINVGGLKVCPEEIEQALQRHPAIAECACVGAADPQNLSGQCVKVFLVAKKSIPDNELVAWLRPQLEEYKIPRLWERVAAIPKTDSGKIQRHLLLGKKQGD